jgi:hypothetical protein
VPAIYGFQPEREDELKEIKGQETGQEKIEGDHFFKKVL